MKKLLWIGLLILVTTHSGLCQSIFTAFGKPHNQADKSFAAGNYEEAIERYENILKKDPTHHPTRLKLAQAYFLVKQFDRAVATYDVYSEGGEKTLPAADLYDYAEAQASLKNYPAALTAYKLLLEVDPENHVVAQKIWRINNINYLFEDSSHFAVRPFSLNTKAGELSPVVTTDGLIFLSNRKKKNMVENANSKSNTTYYKLYRAQLKIDTLTGETTASGKISSFSTGSYARFNHGPIAFYNQETQMVFVASSDDQAENGGHTLGLYFAIKENNKWKATSPFPYNDVAYSIYDVSISKDGTKLFFTSDMKGGKGGKDIYSSEWKDGKWTRPKNAGEIINTPHNESSPCWHESRVLFFSSDGHPGLGGLDLFKAPITPHGYGDPENLGHPVNSSLDDFGISFDIPTHGYFTSNRKNGGYDDDLYELDMDLQTYPFTISGVIKFKEHNLSDEADVRPWPGVKFSLIDSHTGTSVFEGVTDKEGEFSLTISYFSRYYILLMDETGKEHKASLELQKYRLETHVHEIVMVKDLYEKTK